MAVLKVYEPPAPVLREVAKPVQEVDDTIRQLMTDMLDTMYEENGIGLAAPQVGVSKRIVVIDLQERGETEMEPLFIANPEIVWKSEELSICLEGCLSVPGQFAEVERPAAVHFEYLDFNNQKQKIEATGLLATCIQHEIDHLNGILFVDHLSKMKKDMLLKKLKKDQKERGL